LISPFFIWIFRDYRGEMRRSKGLQPLVTPQTHEEPPFYGFWEGHKCPGAFLIFSNPAVN
jgi:hypothetical protein